MDMLYELRKNPNEIVDIVNFVCCGENKVIYLLLGNDGASLIIMRLPMSVHSARKRKIRDSYTVISCLSMNDLIEKKDYRPNRFIIAAGRIKNLS